MNGYEQTLLKWLERWQDSETLQPPKNGWGAEGAAVGDNGMLEWSVLDTQWFGLAQRRKRVFALVDFGDWASRSPILLERRSLRGNTPPSREAGKEITYDVAPCLISSGRGVARSGETRGQDPVVACFGGNNTSGAIGVSLALNAHGGSGRLDFESECFAVEYNAFHSTGAGYWREGFGALRARLQDSHENLIAFPERLSGTQCVRSEDLSPSLGATNPMAVSFRACGQDGFSPDMITPPICSSNGGGSGVPTIQHGMVVRRLTPIECERLQGFPDEFTLIPVRGKPAADGPRYKALGNSMAVPVMAYIGKRIILAVTGDLK